MAKAGVKQPPKLFPIFSKKPNEPEPTSNQEPVFQGKSVTKDKSRFTGATDEQNGNSALAGKGNIGGIDKRKRKRAVSDSESKDNHEEEKGKSSKGVCSSPTSENVMGEERERGSEADEFGDGDGDGDEDEVPPERPVKKRRGRPPKIRLETSSPGGSSPILRPVAKSRAVNLKRRVSSASSEGLVEMDDELSEIAPSPAFNLTTKGDVTTARRSKTKAKSRKVEPEPIILDLPSDDDEDVGRKPSKTKVNGTGKDCRPKTSASGTGKDEATSIKLLDAPKLHPFFVSSSKNKKEPSSLPAPASTSTSPIIISDSPPPPSTKRGADFQPSTSGGFDSFNKPKPNHSRDHPRWPTAEELNPYRQGILEDRQHRRSWIGPISKKSEKGKGKAKTSEFDLFGNELDKFYLSLCDDPSLRPNGNDGSIASSSRPNLRVLPKSAVPSLLFPPDSTSTPESDRALLESNPLISRLAKPLLEAASQADGDATRNSDSIDTFARWPHKEPEQDMWSLKYSPKRAGEVLGDHGRMNGLVLKEWLEKLKIQAANGTPVQGRTKSSTTGSKVPTASRKRKRQVVRRVEKPKKRRKNNNGYDNDSDLDDFIAPSDEDPYPATDSENQDEGHDSDTQAEKSRSPRKNHSFYKIEPLPQPKLDLLAAISNSNQLTNLILLHGPHGSGKTSTVHAVAHELGWQVFEVWPGVGKRARKDVERLVGDVGRNYQVDGRSAGSSTGLNQMKSAFAKMMQPSQAQNSSNSDSTKKAAEPSQSLILLDEVDVLYRDERDFWPGVVELVANSMRPVIMTCSDLECVPPHTLPIQATLYFPPPPPEPLTLYLRTVALLEGHIVPTNDLRALADSGDLRQALSELQTRCQWGIGDTKAGYEWMEQMKETVSVGELAWSEGPIKPTIDQSLPRHSTGIPPSLDSITKQTEIISFVDSFLEGRGPTATEVYRVSLSSATEDVEQPDEPCEASRLALPPLAFGSLRPLGLFPQEQFIMDGIERDGPFNRTIHSMLSLKEPPDPVAASMSYALECEPAMDALLDFDSPLSNRPCIFTDYVPSIRAIVLADDNAEACETRNIELNRRPKRSAVKGSSRYLAFNQAWRPGMATVFRRGLFPGLDPNTSSNPK